MAQPELSTDHDAIRHQADIARLHRPGGIEELIARGQKPVLHTLRNGRIIVYIPSSDTTLQDTQFDMLDGSGIGFEGPNGEVRGRPIATLVDSVLAQKIIDTIEAAGATPRIPPSEVSADQSGITVQG